MTYEKFLRQHPHVRDVVYFRGYVDMQMGEPMEGKAHGRTLFVVLNSGKMAEVYHTGVRDSHRQFNAFICGQSEDYVKFIPEGTIKDEIEDDECVVFMEEGALSNGLML